MVSNTYYRHTLNNGLTLITIPMQAIRSVTGLLLVGAGSRHEAARVNGLSHFWEHMAFKGTKKRPTALAIAEEIDAVGAINNAFTGKEFTGYYIKAASAHLPLIVDILADMLLNSLFAQEEIEKEKGVILEEINMYEDMPPWKVGKNFEELLYRGTPLGWRTIGTKENINRIKRADFLRFLTQWYRPRNAVLVLAGEVGDGRVGTNKLIKLVEEKFSGWEDQRLGEIAGIKESQSSPAVALEEKKTEQSHLVLGVRAYRLGHPARYALGVLTAILGGGMSSRLFQEVREQRGLAYYVRAATQRYRDVGYFAASAGVDKERIEESIQVILAEFAKIREKGVGKKELRKAQAYLEGNLILSLEDSHEVAELYGTSWILERKVRTPEQILAKINAVTAEEVQAVAKKIFVENKLNLAVIGPFADESKFLQLLKI